MQVRICHPDRASGRIIWGPNRTTEGCLPFESSSNLVDFIRRKDQGKDDLPSTEGATSLVDAEGLLGGLRGGCISNSTDAMPGRNSPETGRLVWPDAKRKSPTRVS